MRKIELPNGYTALVDDGDYERVSAHKWSAMVQRRRDGSIRCVYVQRNVWVGSKRSVQLLHRFVMATPVGMYTDHIDGDGLNNRRANLRVCTPAENQHNKRAHGASKIKGVSWQPRGAKWTAHICLDGKMRHLGSFHDEEGAARAYDAAATSNFCDFARLNFQE